MDTPKEVPLVNIQRSSARYKEVVLSKIGKLIDQGDYVLGKEVELFEENFAQFHGTSFGCGVANGTDAIYVALRALDIGPGDEVIVPAHTFIASVAPILMTGAKPVLVDVEDQSMLMDLTKIPKLITPKTKAIIPVHLYGRAVPMNELMDMANHFKLKVIEDCSQAHGAKVREKSVGSFGDMGCFSLYPGKNLGAFGDAGIVITNSPNLAQKLKFIRNHGSIKKYEHECLGVNSRLDTIQAIVLNAKLPHLHDNNFKRIEVAQTYSDLLKDIPELTLPTLTQRGGHVFHLFVVRCAKRDQLVQYLNHRKIGASIHYPTPIHLHKAMSALTYKAGDFPVTEKICKEIVSLPIFPEMFQDEVEYVANTVMEFFK